MKCRPTLVAMTALGIQLALSAGQSANPPAVTAVRAARMIDVNRGSVVSNAVVLSLPA